MRLLTAVDNNPAQLLEYLVTNLGNEDIILGLPWLQRVNPDIDWRKGQITIPGKWNPSMIIEEVPELKEHNKGGNTDRLLEINEHFVPLPHLEIDNDLEIPDPTNDQCPLYRLNGN